MNEIKNFRDLRVWQMSKAIVTQVYHITESFPKQEAYGLTQQLRRSAVSVPSNIAEGHGRGSRKEYTQFLTIARGSLAEMETQLEIAIDLGYVSREEFEEKFKTIEQLAKMLQRLIAALKSPKPKTKNPIPLAEPA